MTNTLNSIDTNKKLADIAGVKPTTYKMGAKVLNSDNDELKQRVLSGETSISAGYKELAQRKQICTDLKTEDLLKLIFVNVVLAILIQLS